MTKFLPGMSWILFFQLLRLLPKRGWDVRQSIDFSLFKFFSQLWTRLIILWIFKVRPQFYNDKTRIIARSCYIWAKSLCWFGVSALSTSWNGTTAASTPQINNKIGGSRENNRAARAVRTWVQLRGVLCKTTTWNNLGDNVSLQEWIILAFSCIKSFNSYPVKWPMSLFKLFVGGV